MYFYSRAWRNLIMMYDQALFLRIYLQSSTYCVAFGTVNEAATGGSLMGQL